MADWVNENIIEPVTEFVDNNFERAYDLVDTFHCLPDIIAGNNFAIPKSFWKNYIKPYSDKWDKSFLTEERRQIFRYLKK